MSDICIRFSFYGFLLFSNQNYLFIFKSAKLGTQNQTAINPAFAGFFYFVKFFDYFFLYRKLVVLENMCIDP